MAISNLDFYRKECIHRDVYTHRLTHILPYNVEAYQEFYRDEFINGFTHAYFAIGTIDVDKGLEIVEKLNGKACRVMPCVSFNPALLNKEILSGACSAIAFRVAATAISLLKNLKENDQLKPANREISFALRFSKWIRDFEENAASMRASNRLMIREIRTEQEALNTITVDREKICSGNAVSEKVGAMAPFYGLKVVESSPEIRVTGNDQLEAQLLEQIRNLVEGVYFLRIIQEKSNDKLEEMGHSLVYIKASDADYFFDPNLGAYALFSEARKANLICNAMQSVNCFFHVDVLSFHRIEEKLD